MLPMSGAGATIHFNIKGRPPAGPATYTMAGYRAVSAGYFEALGIPLKDGRLLDARDRQGATRVIVVNETMARVHFGGHAIGQRIQLGAEPDPDPQFPYMSALTGRSPEMCDSSGLRCSASSSASVTSSATAPPSARSRRSRPCTLRRSSVSTVSLAWTMTR